MENYTAGNNTSVVAKTDETEISEGTRYLFIGFMVLIAIVGIPGNTIVVAVQTRLRVKSSTDYCILTMAVFDLFSATVNTTLYGLRFQPSIRIWKTLASVVFCRLNVFSLFVTNISSTLLLATAAYYRLGRATTTSQKEPATVLTKARWVCVGIAVSSLFYGAVFQFTVTLDSVTQMCIRIDDYIPMSNILIGVLTFIFICSFTIVTVCYIRIAIVLRRHHRERITAKLRNKDTHPIQERRTRISKSKVQPVNIDECMPSTSNEIASSSRANTSQNKIPFWSQAVNSSSRQGKTVTTPTQLTTETTAGFSEHAGNTIHGGKNQDRSNEGYVVCSVEQTHCKRALDALERDRKMINHVTCMMFLITLIYVGTWVVNWSASAYGIFESSNDAVFLAEKLFMINCMINPILYMSMSSKFRIKAKELVC